MTKEKKLTAWTVRMTKDWWYYADVMAEDEADALKVAEQMHDEGKLDVFENDNQDGDWHYDYADENYN